MKRRATSVWNGTIKDGNGHLTSQSRVLKQTPYSFVSRFEGGSGVNPEELMAAAHAGCFTMKLSADLSSAGYPPQELIATSTITLDRGVITQSDLILTAKIDGITEREFQKIAKSAEETCPVSMAYKLKVTLDATLLRS
jgi:osmotically inducible protein OsmC